MDKFEKADFDALYQIGPELGKGYFAMVHSCKCVSSGRKFAAKFIRKRRSLASRQGQPVEDIEREVTILRELQHDNIVTLHRVFDNGTNVILLLDLIREGELFDFISEREKLSEEEASRFVHQILLALQYMHDQLIVHLDIKPENILLERHSSGGDMRVKIIDFGLARRLQKGRDYCDMVGTPEFVAPEVINYEPIWFFADIWSLGVVTHILLTGESPFRGDNKNHTFQLISAAQLDINCDCFDGVSLPAKNFVSRLLVKRADKRPTAAIALTDPWILPVNEQTRRGSHIRRGSIKKMRTFVATPRGVAPPPSDCIEEDWTENHAASHVSLAKGGAHKMATSSEPPLTFIDGATVNGVLPLNGTAN